MSTDRGSPSAGGRGLKGAVTGKAHRKATVRGYLAGTEPLVEVRVVREGGQGDAIDLTLRQSRQLLRLLLDAIEGADELARHDGMSSPAAGRGPAGRDHADVGHQARTRA